MKKSILIIGGMGPQASLLLHEYIIEAATKLGAKDNQDYPFIVHVSVPVEDFITDTAARPRALRMLQERLRPLRSVAFSDAVIACNTAHLLYHDVANAAGVQPHSLIQLAQDEIMRRGASRVGLLATPTTVASHLYRGTRSLDAEGQQQVLQMILSVLAGHKPLSSRVMSLANELLQGGAEAVVLGCTELSVVGQHIRDARIIDPLKLVAEKIMGIAV